MSAALLCGNKAMHRPENPDTCEGDGPADTAGDISARATCLYHCAQQH